jgi:hypothetical protein
MKTKAFVALKPVDDSLPKQAAIIVSVLQGSGGRQTRDVLLRGLSEQLKTTQPVARVFSFYRPMLIERGFLREEEVESPAEQQCEAPDLKMKSVSELEVDFPGDTPLKLKVLRGFKAGDSVTLICGGDVDDHDLWQIKDGKALLVGVVKREKFPTVLKAKDLRLTITDFEWVNRPEALPVEGHHANKTALHSVEASRFTFEDI